MSATETDGSGYEELLAEDQLLARIDTALVWKLRTEKLSAKSEQEKADPAKVGTWEQFVEYCECIERVSDGVLRVKLMDRLAALTPEQREELLHEWASAPVDSYEHRKFGKCSGVISTEQALSTVREARVKLKSKHAVFCTAAKAFEISEGDEFWPGYVTLSPASNHLKKRARASLSETTPFRRWIGTILIKIGPDASALDVAKEIDVSDLRVDDQYRGDGKIQHKKLDKVLLADRTLKKRFGTLVSDVRGLVKQMGN